MFLVGLILILKFIPASSSQSTELRAGNHIYSFCIQRTESFTPSITLYVSSEHAATLHIQSPSVGMNINKVTGGGITSMSLDSRLILSNQPISRKAVEIQSNSSISIYVLINGGGSSSHIWSDGFIVNPIQTYSKEYFVLTYNVTSSVNRFAISASFDDTTITITIKSKGNVSFDGQSYSDGQIIHKTLNKYNTLQVLGIYDLSGTHIKSSKPVTVLSGSRCISIGGSCDIVVSQMAPVAEWGTRYITSNLEMNSDTILKAVASEDGTSIRINNRVVASLNRGQYYEETLGVPTMITIESNKPITIAQFYDMSFHSSGSGSNPFMVILPAIEQFKSKYIFEVPPEFRENFLVLYIDSNMVDGIRLDGHSARFQQKKSVSFFQPQQARGSYFKNTSKMAPEEGFEKNVSTFKSFSAVKITVTKGRHVLTHSKDGTRFGAMLYGVDPSTSYGMFLGYSKGPSCYPECANNGICVADNTCHCQLGYFGQHCEQGNGILNELKPVLYAPIIGTDDNFMDPLAWYAEPPMSISNKVCYVKAVVKNAPQDVIAMAVSLTIDGDDYGNFTVGPIDSKAGITGNVRFACLEVRCPFVTMDGLYRDTIVRMSLKVKNGDAQCRLSNSTPHLRNFTRQSNDGQSDSAEFVLEVGDNYGPYYGVYMAIGDRNKAKYLAEHKCYSGRAYDYDSYNPDIGVLAEFSC